MKKRIRLTIEWDGAADEICYGQQIAKDVEQGDRSKVTTVTEIECLTQYGVTEVRDLPGIPRRVGFWEALWRRDFGGTKRTSIVHDCRREGCDSVDVIRSINSIDEGAR